MSPKMVFRNRDDSDFDDLAVNPEYVHPDKAGVAAPFDFEVSIFNLARELFRRRKLIGLMSITVMMVTATYLFLQPNLYTSQAIILPSGKSAGNISVLKNLIGLGDPMSLGDESSSALYPVILNSNLIAHAVLDKSYRFEHDGRGMQLTLSEYFDQTDPDKLRLALRSITSVDTDQKTGELIVGVETQYPAFSQAILAEYLASLENFNRYKRTSSARENEQYLANQLDSLSRELAVSEDHLEAFQLANLDWAISDNPEILKELGQLKRDVDTKSGIYLMLAQQHETAKLEVRKEIPIVNILDGPSLPTQKSGPFRRNIILLSGLLAAFLTAGGVVLLQLIQDGLSGLIKNDYDALRDDLRGAFPRTEIVWRRMRSWRPRLRKTAQTA